MNFFESLGQFVNRRWRGCLLFWLVFVVLANGVMAGWLNSTGLFRFHVPGWVDVTQDGEFAFLPQDMPSLQSERLFKAAFPRDLLANSVVIVVRHLSTKITEQDRAFVTDVLTPQLEALQADEKYSELISEVINFTDQKIGRMLNSEDGKATLVMVGLNSEFLEHRNGPLIDRIEALISERGELRTNIPAGVHLALSGSATVGRDMLVAAKESAHATELWTIILVIGLLLAIYRAPFLALIPLVSVFVATHISIALITLASYAGMHGIPPFDWLGLKPFDGLKTYVTVVVYGAGVDYCLFLIARYKEEIDRGHELNAALSTTLNKVGAALMASAGTVMCGIGMMIFARFGKFQQAGLGMSFSLLIMLLASLTFTPAMLKLAGKYAFWPRELHPQQPKPGGWLADRSLLSRWLEQNQVQRFWERVSQAVLTRPGRIWLTCVLVMTPLAVIGVWFHGYLSYGLLSELPQTKMSVIGARAVQDHFPAGNTGPLSVLLQHDTLDLSEPDSLFALEEFTDAIAAQQEQLGIADVRSVSAPYGLKIKASLPARVVARRAYLSQEEAYAGKIARFDLILKTDPFSRDSIQQLEVLEKTLPTLLPEALKTGSKLHLVGNTPSIYDLKVVTDRDQWVIDSLVLLVVFLILVLLLRKVAISAYLILSVFFSYFVTLGATLAVFWFLDPNFSGLDWKVPLFLFTILIAVGEDYNIFLMARIEEDQLEFGPIEGIRTALLQTGSIISSCGIIMAGTFFSLVLAGSLVGMQQLGFALSFGVLLDTFIVRPVLVPAYLVMLHTGRFGYFSRWLGHASTKSASTKPQ